MKRPEILAPAGSMKAMEAAIKAGADAVYMGGSRFGARAYADNPDTDELIQAIRYVHLYDKKLYLTLNTLLKEEELCQVGEFLLPYYNAGLDGIIIQDPGVFSYVKEHFPGLPLHASTQMNISGTASAKMLKEAGATRVVPARELSFAEIKEMKEETGLEIETFVHGALCYCYSGRCLMSSMLGGRSGNRGRCAQPCRLPYEVKGNNSGSYVLSPKDLCTISFIPQLCQAGIDSFKLEGRMKNPEYVATIVSIYRKYLDQYLQNPEKEYKVSEEDWQLLLEAYNRGGFTEGYYDKHNGPDMMSMERPNHRGLKAGKVEKIKDGKIYFHTEIEIHKGDLIEIELPENEENITLTSPEDCEKGRFFSLNAQKLKSIKTGYGLYRTGNPWMKRQLDENLLSKEKKISLTGVACLNVGEPAMLSLTLEDGRSLSVKGDIVGQAKERPLTQEQIKKPLLQTGTSRFDFSTLSIEADSDAFIPLGALKKLRRQAFESLEEMLMSQNERTLPDAFGNLGKGDFAKEEKSNSDRSKKSETPKFRVSFEDKENLSVFLSMDEIDGIYLPFEEFSEDERRTAKMRAEENGKKVYYALPYVFRNLAQRQFKEQWREILKEKPAGILIRNIDEFAWIREQCKKEVPDFEIILDQSLYTYNKKAESTYRQWMQADVKHTFPQELNGTEWEDLGLSNGEIIVYGRIPLMVSAQCVTNNTAGCAGNPGYLTMTDRYQKNFYVRRHCRHCYNTIWNGVPLSLQGLKEELISMNAGSLRLHFTVEKEEQIRQVVRTFYEEWNDMMLTKSMRGDFTRGHYRRGIE